MRGQRLTPSFTIVAVLLSLAGNAEAWEFVYGPQDSQDEAFRRVSLVSHCPAEGFGYLAVGTLNKAGDNPDVYAVYTDLDGNRVWEFGYDIEGGGLVDTGMAVAPIPAGGFVILSNSLKGNVSRIALTQIRCDGLVQWSRIYGDFVNKSSVSGQDLIRTQQGDLAVAGKRWNGENEDALLLRTTPAGALMWNFIYDSDGKEAFHALTEAWAPCCAVVADLVAVGSFERGDGNQQALVARVDGASGNIGALPECVAHHGGPASDEVYDSVIRLGNAQGGEYVMVGTTTGPWLSDIYISRGNPCNLAAQSRIGNPAGVQTTEKGYDLVAVSGAAQAQLAVTGSFKPPGGGTDATFLKITAATLMPIGGSGRIFGDYAGAADIFYSLAEDTNVWPQEGYILAGMTESQWIPGDLRDLYLVHYDPAADPGCEKPWSPAGFTLPWIANPLQAIRSQLTEERPVKVSVIKYETAESVCPRP